MRRILIFILIIFFIPVLSGQINKFGIPTMKSYSTQVTQGTEYNWSIVKDKTGVAYFGNDNCVLRFDGHTWSKIAIRKSPFIRALTLSDEGVIYVGGTYEFGYIEPEKNGSPVYVSISQRYDLPEADTTDKSNNEVKKAAKEVNIGEILSVVTTDSVVYFFSYESMFAYNPKNDSVRYVNLRDFELNQVQTVKKIGDRIFMADNVEGLFELKDNKPVRVTGGEFFAMKMTMVILPCDDNSLFIGTLKHGVFRFDLATGKTSDALIDKNLNEQLKSVLLYRGVETPSGQKILGTLTAGIFVLDKNYKLVGKWDKATSDLANDAIAALYIGDDPTSELWISTGGYTTKAYVGEPIYEIPPRLGYESLVNVLTSFNNSFYLSTDGGLFKSYESKEGFFLFERVGDNRDQYFPVSVCEVGQEKFVLAGSNQGLLQIKKDGSATRVDEKMIYPPDVKRTGYNIRSILQSAVNPNRFYIGLSTKGLVVTEYNGKTWKYVRQIKTGFEGFVSAMAETKQGDLIIFTGKPEALFLLHPNDTSVISMSAKDGLPTAKMNSLSKLGDKIVLTTANGLMRYDGATKRWSAFDELVAGYSKGKDCRDIYLDESGDIWLTISDTRISEVLLKKDSLSITPYKGEMNILPSLEKNGFTSIEGKYFMTKNEVIYVIDKEKLIIKKPTPKVLLTKILIGADSLLMNSSFYEKLADGKNIPVFSNKSKTIPEIKYNYNSVSFSWTLPYFIEEESTVFRYKLDGFDKVWSKWEKTYYKDFTNLPFGKYTLRVQAKTLTDLVSEETSFEFYILKPWYLKGYMIVLYAIAVILIILGIIVAYTRKLKNENIRLEGIVAERTAVVVKQKEELESSIHYASRIQMALLPSEAIISQNLKNYFILFKPRDIVSGDFYWMTKKENRLYIVAADCTGHGVPGAFMSLLGMSFLDEIIDKEKAPRADHVLSELRLHVTESLKQSGEDNEAKDGMDMSLLVIDFNVSKIEFSGAYNPCFRVRKLTDEEIKNYHEDGNEMPDGSMSNGKYLLETIFASKMPIGISSRMDEKFVFYDWALEKGVSYYLFSDGYIDQFGGQSGRKFMKKNFKRLILDIQDYPMNKQKELMDKNLKDWMGQSPQIDDILVMGIRTD